MHFTPKARHLHVDNSSAMSVRGSVMNYIGLVTGDPILTLLKSHEAKTLISPDP
jgi:hypothetical protein